MAASHTVPKGWPLAAALIVGAVAVAAALRPSATLHELVMPAVEAALGCPASAFHVRFVPGERVELSWAEVGTPERPLSAGPSDKPPATETVVIRNALVWLPGNIRLDEASGKLRRTQAGAQAELFGRASVAGVVATGTRIEVVDGGRLIRFHAGHLRLEPRGVRISAYGVSAELRRTSLDAGPWQGELTCRRVLLAGVPGSALRATLTVEPTGHWSALPLTATLAGGALRGHASWRSGTLRLGGRVRQLSLAEVPPGRLGATEPFRGLVDARLEASVRGDDITGSLTATGRGLAITDMPALLVLTRALQFRMRREQSFASGRLEAALVPAGLVLDTFELTGRSLTIALRGRGSVGWDGLLALPLRATAPKGLFGGVPVVGNVIGAMRPGAREPVSTDIDLGGWIDEPEGNPADG